jgi:hypothetical protein
MAITSLHELYSRANQQVQNLLKPGWDGTTFDPADYWSNFCDWLEDHPVARTAALAAWGIKNEDDEDGQLLRGLEADTHYRKLPDWITTGYEEDLAVYLDGQGAHLAPTGTHVKAEREQLLPRTTWLVHFSYQAEAIAVQGFRKGFSDPRRLGLTMHFPEEAPEKQGAGYNFAFLAGSQDMLEAASTERYGNGAVMFQNSGVQVYHHADEETQIIFQGNQVNPQGIVHLKMWNDHSWSVMSKVTRKALFSGSIGQCADWVKANFQQYHNQFALPGNTYNKQTMQLNEEALQRSIARYCSEHQADIRSGVLTEAQVYEEVSQALLAEGIITGIKGLFAPGSTVQQAAGQLGSRAASAVQSARTGVQQKAAELGNRATDAFQTARTAVQQGVEKLQNDYSIGAASGELRSLAQQRTKAEEQFTDKMARFKENVAQIQQQRYALRKEHRALLRTFHQQAHGQYVRAAQGLGIPVSKGNSFYDAVDQALETRQMVPAVLTEGWGKLDEGEWGQVPVFEESPLPVDEPTPEPGFEPDPSLTEEALQSLRESQPNPFKKYVASAA